MRVFFDFQLQHIKAMSTDAWKRLAVAVLVIDGRDEDVPSSPNFPKASRNAREGGPRVLVGIRKCSQGSLAPLALPGGKVEASLDASILHAAARELREETGLAFPPEAFAERHTLETEEFVVKLVSVICPADRISRVRNVEPEKHGPWHWRSWRELREERAERIFAPLRALLCEVDPSDFYQRADCG